VNIFKKGNQKFKNRGDAIMSKGSVSISSYVRVVRSILTIVITLSLFTASVPVSTYAAIQAPPPRK
jgi:hypothetical protein